MKFPFASMALALSLSSCAHVNQPRCKDYEVRPFEPWPHQGQWQTGTATLPYSCWPASPPKQPRAVVILVQGWDSSGRDYDSIGRRLAREGYAVYASENRCGQCDSNPRRRGTTPGSGHDWVEDLANFTTMVRQKHPGVPFFYHGHSMGCLVAIETVAEADKAGQPKGLILHSPAMPMMSENRRLVLNALLLPVAWVRAPHLRIIDPEKNGPFASAEVNCRWLKSSDRVRRGYEVEFVRKAAGLGHEARLDSRTLTIPVLAMGGGSDWIVSRNKKVQKEYIAYLSREVAGGPENAGGHAQSRFYPDGHHILTEGPTGQRALDDIVQWLAAHGP